MTARSRQYVERALAIALTALVFACAPRADSVLSEIEERGVLRVATIEAPTIYFQGREGPAGFEHDLANAYAAHLGVTTEFVVRPSLAAVLEAVDGGDADLAAAGLTALRGRRAPRRYSPSYKSMREKVVCGRGVLETGDVDDVDVLNVVVEAGSHHLSEPATAGRVWLAAAPDKTWETLAHDVSSGAAPCTVLDEHAFALMSRYTSNLHDVGTLEDERELAWALGGGLGHRSVDLARDLRAWFRARDTQVLVERLLETYYGFQPEETSRADAARFRTLIRRRLPQYESLFRAEGERAGVPWTLLAAVAYQESHWNPLARSPTGVRGMMMLTRPTAAEMGVESRVDAAQSVRGGARYLRRLYDRLPETIAPEDRWWFAAAAYNMGFSHLRSARRLTERRGRDPNAWADVREVLHLLEDPDVYADLPTGRANGMEARTYVPRVRDYADVLEKRFAERVGSEAAEGEGRRPT